MIIDFHNHYFPPEYLKALSSGPTAIRISEDSDGNPILSYPGDYNVVVPGHRDIKYRRQVLDQERIDRQVLTFTTPGTHLDPPARSVPLARLINDSLAAIAANHGKRFSALATLPLNDPAAAVHELDRACRQLSLPGAMLFSNVNGVALSDERFWPLYAKAEELGAVLFIHPIHPVGVEAMLDFWLMPLVGFLFDTTLAAAKLVFSGVVERFPGVRWVLAHLGGAIPYLAERLDRGFYAFEECWRHIQKPPSEYLKGFYYDTVNFDPNALELAVRFAGADHVLAGSDYPHRIGSLGAMKRAIGDLRLSEQDRANILGGNAARLLRLT